MLYKLTDLNGKTCNNTQWGEGVTHRAPGSHKQEMCSNGWIHAYRDPHLAIIFNPIHANFRPARLWLAKGKIGKQDRLKVACRSLTTIKEIDLPKVTTKQLQRFSLLVALHVYPLWERYDVDRKWRKWAAYAAAAGFASAAYDAAHAASVAASVAAHDAARVAARAAVYARTAAAHAASVAAAVAEISFQKILQEALKEG